WLEMSMSALMPWNDSRNIRSHPPMTLMTTSTIVVQSMTATSDTQAMRRLRRYLRIRWSLYIGFYCRGDACVNAIHLSDPPLRCKADGEQAVVLAAVFEFARTRPTPA